jgi:hypothetical protein
MSMTEFSFPYHLVESWWFQSQGAAGLRSVRIAERPRAGPAAALAKEQIFQQVRLLKLCLLLLSSCSSRLHRLAIPATFQEHPVEPRTDPVLAGPAGSNSLMRPLLPSDSVSNLAGRDEGLRRSATTASRSEASNLSRLTETNLRRANSVSGSRQLERSRTERFAEEPPPVIMPPPSPSRVSHGSLRRSESSRPGPSHRQDRRLLTWPEERAPSQASHSSSQSGSSRHRFPDQHEQRLLEWREEPSPSEVSRTPSRRSDHDNTFHHSRSARRSSYSYSDSDATVRPPGSSRSSAVSRGSTVRDRVRDFFSGESSEAHFLRGSRRGSHSLRKSTSLR